MADAARRGPALVLSLLLSTALAPGPARAQDMAESAAIGIAPDLDRDDVAGARQDEPALRPRPLPLGPLLAQAELSLVMGFDSNLYNRPAASPAAFVAIMPALDLRADLPRHDLRLAGQAALRRYARGRREDADEYALRADGRLDIGPSHSVHAAAAYAQGIEPRGSAGASLDAAAPIRFADASADLRADLRLGPLRLLPGLRLARRDYDPAVLVQGGAVDQSFRDTRSLRAGTRIEYALSGLLGVFAEASEERIDSPHAAPLLRRDASDRAVLAGLRGAITPLVSGELALGWRHRDHALPEYRDFRGLTFRADLQWYATPLLTLRARARRDFRNSGIRQVGGILTDSAMLEAWLDPLPRLRLAARAGVERGTFAETGTRSHRAMMRLQARYRISLVLALGAYAGALRQRVAQEGGNGPPLVAPFTSFSAGIGVTITP